MTEDEQSGTLAFLQNFYTGVTLYLPLEAEAQPVAAVASAAPAAPAPTAVAAVAPVAAAPVTAPAPLVVPAVAVAPQGALVTSAPPLAAAPLVAPLPMLAGKLPSLATVPLSAPGAPAAAAQVPTAVVPAAPAPLAAAPAPPVPPPVAPYLLTTFATLGSNAQGVVVLVRLPPEQFKKLPRNVFLNKLLQAIQLVMADVVLVNVEGPYPVALQNLRKEIAATHLLAFGKNLLDVAVRTTQIYEPVQFPAVGLSYLAGAEVEMIEYDVSLKKRLWGGLQRMFLG